MRKLLLSRLLQAIPTLWVIATLTFFMTRFAPGGPFDSEKAIAEEIRVKLESHFGLDRPLFEQYLIYLQNLLHGDLGPSFKYPEWNVSELIATAFPVSLTLGILSLLIALCIGIPIGMIAALRRNSWMDYLPMSLSMAGICLPTFVLGPLLIFALSTNLGVLPPLGWYGPGDWVLPSLDSRFILCCLYRPSHPCRNAGNPATRLHQNSPGERSKFVDNSNQACSKRRALTGGHFFGSSLCWAYYRFLCH